MPSANQSQRKWLFRGLAILISLAPLIAAEIILRQTQSPIIDSVDPDPWVDLHQLQPLFTLNQKSNRWEIPESRSNFFCSDSFPATKSEKTRRIFVLGGSTVQGRPYATETAFSTWLRLLLESSDSQSHYEVINCGGVSYASYRVAKILDEVLEHQPDAIVLYTGHNEFLEDREYAEVREVNGLRKHLITLARHSHLARWLNHQLASLQSPARTPTPNAVMPEEVQARLDQKNGLERYRRDPHWVSRVEEHFSATLEEMISKVRQAEIPLVLCVPASDLLATPPFKTTTLEEFTTEQTEKFSEYWLIARNPQQSDSDRQQAASKCLELDSKHAGAHYVLGRIAFDLGQQQKALQHLTLARDHDVCPLRATTEIVSAIQQHDHRNGVLLVDLTKMLDQQNGKGINQPDGIPDANWFVDHVHPSIKGHQVIAHACFDAMQEISWVKTLPDVLAYDAQTTAHLSQLNESYFARGKQRLEGLRRWTQGRATEPIVD